MSFCSDAAVNLDWQWTENSDPAKQKWALCPGSAVNVYANSFKNINGQMVDQSPPGFTADYYVMNSLELGQGHNVTAQQSYVNCRAKQASLHRFMRLVLTAAPGHQSDFADAAANIAWQIGANPKSIHDASINKMRSIAVDEGMRYYYSALAVECLCEGQLHNAAVLRQYRACFRDDQHRLFALLPLPLAVSSEA